MVFQERYWDSLGFIKPILAGFLSTPPPGVCVCVWHTKRCHGWIEDCLETRSVFGCQCNSRALLRPYEEQTNHTRKGKVLEPDARQSVPRARPKAYPTPDFRGSAARLSQSGKGGASHSWHIVVRRPADGVFQYGHKLSALRFSNRLAKGARPNISQGWWRRARPSVTTLPNEAMSLKGKQLGTLSFVPAEFELLTSGPVGDFVVFIGLIKRMWLLIL